MSSTCRRKKNATLNEFHSLEGSVSHLDGLKASFMGKRVGEDIQTEMCILQARKFGDMNVGV